MDQVKRIIISMKALDRQVTKQFEQKTAISMTRYELLSILNERGTISQQVLKQVLQIDQAAITRHLKLLEEAQLVTRCRNEQNNREVLVSITAQGKRELNECACAKDDFLKQLVRNLSQQQLKDLEQLLMTLQRNSDECL
jgi:DNA-binding MarR family transcriptional regulator